MEKKDMRAFFEALSKDEAVQKALKEKELAYIGTKEHLDSIIEEILLPVANAAGYNFTLEDLLDFEKDMRLQGELDEDELESIAGGKVWGVCVGFGIGYGSSAYGTSSCFILGGALCVVVGRGA